MGVPVICMPGALGTAETDFFAQFPGLSHRHRVISFDPRGYGKSRPPAREWSADFYHRDARDAHAIMEQLNIDAYNVIGWSDGANAAAILAAEQPVAVRKLVLIAGNPVITQKDIEQLEPTRDVKKSWSQGMLNLHLPVYGDDLQPMWDGFNDAMMAIFARGGSVCEEEAKVIQCPTFVMQGQRDPLVPMFHAEWFHRNIPTCKLHVFPEGKHNPHIKYADEFNRLVLDFFADAPALTPAATAAEQTGRPESVPPSAAGAESETVAGEREFVAEQPSKKSKL